MSRSGGKGRFKPPGGGPLGAAWGRLAKGRGFFAFSVNWPGVSLVGMKNRADKT
jgi:hypothetical protein